MEIMLCDGYKVKAVDALNWQVHQEREVKKKDGTVAVEWVGLPAYFRDLPNAVQWVAWRIPKADRSGTYSLADALAELRAIAEDIRRSSQAYARGQR